MRVRDREQAVEREALRKAAKQLPIVRADDFAEHAVDLGIVLGRGELCERGMAARAGVSIGGERRGECGCVMISGGYRGGECVEAPFVSEHTVSVGEWVVCISG